MLYIYSMRKSIFTSCEEVAKNGGEKVYSFENPTSITNTRIYVSQWNKDKDKKVSCNVRGMNVHLFVKA